MYSIINVKDIHHLPMPAPKEGEPTAPTVLGLTTAKGDQLTQEERKFTVQRNLAPESQ